MTTLHTYYYYESLSFYVVVKDEKFTLNILGGIYYIYNHYTILTIMIKFCLDALGLNFDLTI